MRIKNLNYFIELEKCGSINKASKNLYTSPQNLSRIIRSVESDLNTTLFLRDSNGVEFTENGKLFLDFCKTTKNSFNKLTFKIHSDEYNKNITGNVRVFITKVLVEAHFNDIILKFKKFYPNVTVQMTEVDTLYGYNIIKENPHAIGILSNLPLCSTSNDFIFYDIGSLDFGILVSNDHPFSKMACVDINDIVKEKIMIFSQNELELSDTYIFIKQFYKEGEEPKLDVTSNATGLYSSVISNNNICFVYKKLHNNKEYIDTVTLVDVSGVSDRVDFSIVQNKNAVRTEAENAFIQFSKHYLEIFI